MAQVGRDQVTHNPVCYMAQVGAKAQRSRHDRVKSVK